MKGGQGKGRGFVVVVVYVVSFSVLRIGPLFGRSEITCALDCCMHVPWIVVCMCLDMVIIGFVEEGEYVSGYC